MTKPNSFPCPGNTIKMLLTSEGLAVRDLSARTGLPLFYLTRLLAGDATIDLDVAVQLERVLGVSAGVWERLEAAYRSSLIARMEQFALECEGRGLDLTTIVSRARHNRAQNLPEPYVEALADSARTDGKLLYDEVVLALEHAISEPESVWAEKREAWKAVSDAFKGSIRVLFRDKWTPEDHANEAVHQRAVSACETRHRAALWVRGWRIYDRRDHMNGRCAMRRWADDPATGETLLYDDAKRVAEAREPGVLESYPKRDFVQPPSEFPQFDIGEVKVQPMKAPMGGVFYMGHDPKE